MRHCRQGQKLVVIGKHKYRKLETSNWEVRSDTAEVANRTAARGVQQLEKDPEIELTDLTEETDRHSEIYLEDEETIIVSPTQESEQDAGKNRVCPHSHLIPCSPQCGEGCPSSGAEDQVSDSEDSRELNECSAIYDLDSEDSSVITTVSCSLPQTRSFQ